MKKLSRLSVMTFALSSASLLLGSAAYAAHPDYKNEVYKGEVVAVAPAPVQIFNVLHDGIYVGAGLGYDSFRFRQSITVKDGVGTTSSFNPPLAARGFNGSLFAGYGQYYDRFYIAGEITLASSTADTSYGFATDEVNFRTKVNARGSYGASIIPGIKVSPSTLIYARLGFMRTSFKSQERVIIPALNVNEGISKSSWGNGTNYGIGIETAVYKDISVRGEYNYIAYGSFSSDVGTKFSPSNHQFVISGIYHFC